MKRIGLGGAVVLLSAGAALATDLPAKAPAYKAAAPFSWSGFYVGGHGGYAFGDFDAIDTGFVTPAVNHYKPDGWFGGVQFGYNNHFAPHWLLGAEIDFSGASLKDSGPTTGSVLAANYKLDYFGTARTRFGYVQDRTLLYVTGGAAWTHDKYSEGVPGSNWVDPAYRVGWTIGGGIEYALDAHWSAKLEYLYADFGHYESYLNGGFVRRDELTANLIRAGINYRFGGSDPDQPASAMPVKAAPPPRYSWTGGYAGLNGMYAAADLHSLDTFFGPPPSGKGSPDGFFAGVQGGYNWQIGNTLVGFETDNSFGDMKDDTATNVGGTRAYFKVSDIGTVRGRIGGIADRLLVYGTGGLAYAHVRFNQYSGPNSEAGLDGYRIGWTGGGGLEYALDPNWTAKVEYLYADLGKQHFDTITSFTRTLDMTMNTVKVGVNYRGPLIERLFGGQ